MSERGTQECRIFGPPGTGKTTTLSGLIATAVRDYGPEAVLVSSFTRTAAKELVSRGLPLPDEHIGTLHAMCYRALERPKIATGAVLKEWNEEYPTRRFGGIQVDPDDPYGNPDASGAEDGDKLLQDLNRLRGLGVPRDAWPTRVESFAVDWDDFKANTHTVDFTDLIDQCVTQELPIPHAAQVLFLDEVQDFSALELSLVRHWGAQCERFYVCGDDDQTLYQFKGATPQAFLSPELPHEQVRVLAQSYRIPRAVHAAAMAWIEQIPERMPKAYQPRNADGDVSTVPITYQYVQPIKGYLDEWLAAGKTVAFLTSCSFFLDPLKRQLRDWGLPFHNPYRPTRGDWNPLCSRAGTISAAKRLLAYQQVAHEQRWWTYADLWHWGAMLEADGVFHRGAKTAMRRKAEAEETATALVDPTDLDAWFADDQAADAASAGNLTWLRGHLLSTYDRPMGYACNVMESYGREALKQTPLVSIGTIHSYKGAEADVVVLFPDLSPAGLTEWQSHEGRDAIRRCFYVGMTRAKEGLYWAQPAGPSIGGYQ